VSNAQRTPQPVFTDVSGRRVRRLVWSARVLRTGVDATTDPTRDSGTAGITGSGLTTSAYDVSAVHPPAATQVPTPVGKASSAGSAASTTPTATPTSKANAHANTHATTKTTQPTTTQAPDPRSTTRSDNRSDTATTRSKSGTTTDSTTSVG
jgi:hypothetical protein